MEISGKIIKDDRKGWIIEIPILDIVSKSETKIEIPEMIQKGIKELINDRRTLIKVRIIGDDIFININNMKKLFGLMLKRLRTKNQIKLKDLKIKSINNYTKYEQSKEVPTFDKLEQLLNAMEPKRKKYLIYI